MTRQLMQAALAFGVVFTTSVDLQAQTTQPATTVSRGELKRQISTAHTPEQYRAIALYFRQQEGLFRSRAAEEKTEWDRRKLIVNGVTSKYPTPADSARNLYDYYTYKANEMSGKAAEFEKKSGIQQPTGSV